MEKQIITVTGSYSENLSPENHGIPGMRFENRSFFLSANENILQEEATPEKIKEVGEKLHAICKALCKESTRLEVRELKKAANMTVDPTGDEYKEIADIITAFESIVTKEDVANASKIFAERKDKLNDVQKDFLIHVEKKANARTLGQ